jgi:hypothetical protein
MVSESHVDVDEGAGLSKVQTLDEKPDLKPLYGRNLK